MKLLFTVRTPIEGPLSSTRPPLKIRIEDPILISKGSCIGKNSIRRPPKMSGKKIVDPSSIGVPTVFGEM